jgi:hypothetical protein
VPVGDAAARGVAADRAGATGSAGEALELRFELPAGSYATVLVEELFPGTEIDDGPPDRETGAAGAAASEMAE